MLVALDTHAKKINPPSIILGWGGVQDKACWLIDYYALQGINMHVLERKTFTTLLHKIVHYLIINMSCNFFSNIIYYTQIPVIDNLLDTAVQ